MSPIDLGIGMDEDDEYYLIEPGIYDFFVRDVLKDTTKKGRPNLIWKLDIDTRDSRGRIIYYNTPLPWKNPEGEMDTSGARFLLQMFKGLGLRWEGTVLPDVWWLCVGKTGQLKVSLKRGPGRRKGKLVGRNEFDIIAKPKSNGTGMENPRIDTENAKKGEKR